MFIWVQKCRFTTFLAQEFFSKTGVCKVCLLNPNFMQKIRKNYETNPRMVLNGVKDVRTYAPSEEESWMHGTVWENRGLIRLICLSPFFTSYHFFLSHVFSYITLFFCSLALSLFLDILRYFSFDPHFKLRRCLTRELLCITFPVNTDFELRTCYI